MTSPSRQEDRESGIPLLSRSKTRERTSALNDKNPPSYFQCTKETRTQPNVVPRLTNQTQAATDNPDPVNEAFLRPAVNIQPRSGSTQSQELQTTV